jgi:hypothetical protein
MIRSSFLVLALGAFAATSAATPAAACCGCAVTCGSYATYGYAQPVPYNYQPYYMVNQGPDYSGNFLVRYPTIESEGYADYPYVGGGYYRPYPVAPYYRHTYWGPYRHRVYRGFSHGYAGGTFYRHGFGPRGLTVSAGHWGARVRVH